MLMQMGWVWVLACNWEIETDKFVNDFPLFIYEILVQWFL